jgi:hypothetical protein
LLIFTDYSAVLPTPVYVNGVVNNVEFIGGEYGVRICASKGIGAIPDITPTSSGNKRSHIDLAVTDCNFNAFNHPIEICYIKEAEIRLGKMGHGNTISNGTTYAVEIYDVINAEISLVGNTFNIPAHPVNGYGVYYVPYPDNAHFIFDPQTKNTLIKVESNTFNINGGKDAINVRDDRRHTNPYENLPVLVEIKDNVINMTGNPSIIGIKLNQVAGAVVRNNRFTGSGAMGVNVTSLYSHIPPHYSENALLLGNNFSNAAFSMASIFLGTWSKNCTVIGGGNNEYVVNNVFNNVITGLNIKDYPDPPGQIIEDNLELIRDAMKDMDNN